MHLDEMARVVPKTYDNVEPLLNCEKSTLIVAFQSHGLDMTPIATCLRIYFMSCEVHTHRPICHFDRMGSIRKCLQYKCVMNGQRMKRNLTNIYCVLWVHDCSNQIVIPSVVSQIEEMRNLQVREVAPISIIDCILCLVGIPVSDQTLMLLSSPTFRI